MLKTTAMIRHQSAPRIHTVVQGIHADSVLNRHLSARAIDKEGLPAFGYTAAFFHSCVLHGVCRAS